MYFFAPFKPFILKSLDFLSLKRYNTDNHEHVLQRLNLRQIVKNYLPFFMLILQIAPQG